MKTQQNSSKGLIGAGILTSVLASLCCITPVLALVAGISGAASSFSWLEPARPFLIGSTVLVLGFAWYQKLKLKSKAEIDCECDDDASFNQKPSFWQSRKFLGMVTVFAAVMLAFPYYSGLFFSTDKEEQMIILDGTNIIEVSIPIEGMTCTGCEHSVNYALNNHEGVIDATSSYESGTAKVKFDTSKVSIDQLGKAVEKETGYKVAIN